MSSSLYLRRHRGSAQQSTSRETFHSKARSRRESLKTGQDPQPRRLTATQIITDFVVRLPEPHDLRLRLESSTLSEAVQDVANLSTGGIDAALQSKLQQHMESRARTRNERYENLLQDLMSIAQGSDTHWRYKSNAARFLRALLRRDHVRSLFC